MKNKVQVSGYSLNLFLLLFLLMGSLMPLTVAANRQHSYVQPKAELKVRVRGSNLEFSFPRTQYKSALKLINTNGSMVKAVMVDEGVEQFSLTTSQLPKGIYQCVLENRVQRFCVKLMLM